MEKRKYVARKGGQIRQQDAQAIGEFLEKIKIRTTENILAEIEKHPEHPIHGYVFNNTDQEAIIEYRLYRVRLVVQSVMYELDKKGNGLPMRVFYNIVNSKGTKKYKTAEEVFKNTDYSNQVIDRAVTELNHWNLRYKVYSELKQISAPIEQFVKAYKKSKKKKR